MAEQKLKILSVNTHKGFSWFNRKFILHELRSALRSADPDVVFLQEVLGEHHYFANQYAMAWPKISQYEFLADQVWPDMAYGRNAVYPHGHHGNALLSRFPINQWHNHDISLNGIERRGLLHCHIVIDGKSVHTVCVHLSLREKHRQIQLQELSKLVNSLPKDETVIVAGDFNDWRGKAHSILFQQCGLIEAFRQRNGHSEKTFPAAFPILRLDRIYIRKGQSYEITQIPKAPWSKLSDHKPIMIEISL